MNVQTVFEIFYKNVFKILVILVQVKSFDKVISDRKAILINNIEAEISTPLKYFDWLETVFLDGNYLWVLKTRVIHIILRIFNH